MIGAVKVVKKQKKRLDQLLLERHAACSRTQLQSWIMQGLVKVDGLPVTKPGVLVDPTAEVVLDVQEPRFVCRAGAKLEAALEHFNIDATDLVVMDAGLSTGGFSDCLLQRGAKRIYGVDVGYGQTHERIRADERVVVMERTNLRHLESLPEPIDLVTLDLSFISVLKVMDAVCRVLKPDGGLVVLIKPQFEAERAAVGRGGIVKDPAVHERVVRHVVDGIVQRGFVSHGHIESPILGGQGNKEFLAYFTRS